jgi:hypothetical protein
MQPQAFVTQPPKDAVDERPREAGDELIGRQPVQRRPAPDDNVVVELAERATIHLPLRE